MLKIIYLAEFGDTMISKSKSATAEKFSKRALWKNTSAFTSNLTKHSTQNKKESHNI